MAVVWDPTGQISIDTRIAVRGLAWKYPCVAATTGSITVSTALNNGDTIDGVTLVTGDHVLVKDNASSVNGIWVVGATPTRSPDMDQDQTTDVKANETLGAFVYVIGGGTNGGKLFYCTNTSTPIIGTTTLVFAEFSPSAPTGDFELNIEGGQSVISPHGNMGSTETFDPTAGNVHTGTLDASCTFTLSTPVGSGAAMLELWITGDGTNTWTWPGSVVWSGGSPPDPPADVELKRVVLETLDGGSTWYGVVVGSGGSGRWELAVIPGSPPDSLYADGDWLYIFIP